MEDLTLWQEALLPLGKFMGVFWRFWDDTSRLPQGKNAPGGTPPTPPEQPQGWTPAPRGDVPLPSRTWKHHLGILPFPWATSVGGSRIQWQKAVSEAVPFSVLLLPAPAMAITCPKQDPSVLTQSSFGLRFKRVWELLCYQ